MHSCIYCIKYYVFVCVFIYTFVDVKQLYTMQYIYTHISLYKSFLICLYELIVLTAIV
jgi:hypothetical protein